MLQTILKDQSRWTWEAMDISRQLGEMIREDALTTINLIEITKKIRAQQIDLSITSLQGAHLEREIGADWFWSVQNNDQPGWVIQAKRLDIIDKIPLQSYNINIPQMQKLIQYSEAMSQEYNREYNPVYVFYNFIEDLSVDPNDYGCMYIYATLLRDIIKDKYKLNQRSVVVRYLDIVEYCVPWWKMFA